MQVFQQDVQTVKAEFQSLSNSVQTELKDATDSDKARYLRAQLDLINQRLVHLENYTTAHLQRYTTLKHFIVMIQYCSKVWGR